ncbi:MAG UNVERIFIED_CONTAM: hypothetical protein LVT10_13480 [Anaerolineae bacterium]
MDGLLVLLESSFLLQDIRTVNVIYIPILVFFLVLAIVVTFTPFGTFL